MGAAGPGHAFSVIHRVRRGPRVCARGPLRRTVRLHHEFPSRHAVRSGGDPVGEFRHRNLLSAAEEILAAGKIPFLLGGEHLVTLGAVRAVAKRYPDLHVIHFDAHADLRADYLGVQLSHACVMRRCHDLLGDGRIFQFGIRSGTREEFAFMRDGHVVTEPFSDATLPQVVESIPPDAPVYLTVDMDVLDPSAFPGTGTPEAGGFTYRQLVSDVVRICGQLNVVGLDNVELAPTLDPTGRSTALACTFLRESLLALA